MPLCRSLPLALLAGPVLVSALVAGCKENVPALPDASDAGVTQVTQETGERVLPARRSGKGEGLYASDAEMLQKNALFYFRMFDAAFSKRFAALPLQGEVPDTAKPMSGGYYPEKSGGTDTVMVGDKSPLAKYDAAFHAGADKAQAWEREKHASTVEWAGHCNGFSAASQRHPREPKSTVVKNGVSFDPRDIKALLAEVYMNADYEFLGGARCEHSTAPAIGARVDPTVMDACEDINPGTLHAAIANWIGRKQHVLIMDQFAGDQVWNFPLVQYAATAHEISAAEAQAQIQSGSGANYIFNPAAASFVAVSNILTYVEAQRTEVLGKRYVNMMTLTYVLELDALGDIVGGEWTGASQTKHPDFLWLALPPLPGNGTRQMGNPHLDANEVIRLWAESAGLDPDRPPPAITRPPTSLQWGRWPKFNVILDGRTNGAVFAGKPTVLRVARQDALAAADVSLSVSLDDAPLASLTGAAHADLTHAFTVGPGLHRLIFTFQKGGIDVETQSLRFHVMR